jgi:hypothetical protein
MPFSECQYLVRTHKCRKICFSDATKCMPQQSSLPHRRCFSLSMQPPNKSSHRWCIFVVSELFSPSDGSKGKKFDNQLTSSRESFAWYCGWPAGKQTAYLLVPWAFRAIIEHGCQRWETDRIHGCSDNNSVYFRARC